MAGVHNLVKSEEQPGNLPNYRYYVECSCGWQARSERKEVAESQHANHQQYHGYNPPSKEDLEAPKNTQEMEAAKKQSNQQEKKESGGSSVSGATVVTANSPVVVPQGGIRRVGQN